MDGLDLNLLRAFLAVSTHGSFSRAAEALAVPRSTVSRAVANLESSLGLTLFHRTTRKVELSTAGAVLLDRVRPALASLESALRDLPEKADEPAGLMRVTTTVDLGAAILGEICARYTRRYPEVRVEALLTNKVVDLAKDGFDVGLRVSTSGPLKDSALVATRVGAISFQLYAAPSYLSRVGAPKTPEELLARDWISFGARVSNSFAQLEDGKIVKRLDLEARIACEDMGFVRTALRSGAGIGVLPSFMVGEDVASGALTRVLPRWDHRGGIVYLVHPGRKRLPARVRTFLEVAAETFKQRPLSTE